MVAITVGREFDTHTPGGLFRDHIEKYGNSETLQVVIAFTTIFLILFATYSVGQAWIGLGSRLRQRFFRAIDPKRFALVATSENDFLQKMFLETKSSCSMFDGLGIGFFVFFACAGIRMAELNSWIYCVIGFLVALVSVWAFWREADKRYRDFDACLSEFLTLNSRLHP